MERSNLLWCRIEEAILCHAPIELAIPQFEPTFIHRIECKDFSSFREYVIGSLHLKCQVVRKPVVDNSPVHQNVLPKERRDAAIVLSRTSDVYGNSIHLEARVLDVPESNQRRFPEIFGHAAYSRSLADIAKKAIRQSSAVPGMQ